MSIYFAKTLFCLMLFLLLLDFLPITTQGFPEGTTNMVVRIEENLSCQIELFIIPPYNSNYSSLYVLIPIVVDKVQLDEPYDYTVLYKTVGRHSLLSFLILPYTSQIRVIMSASQLLEKRIERDLSASYTLLLDFRSEEIPSSLQYFKGLPNTIDTFEHIEIIFPHTLDPYRVDEFPEAENRSLYSRVFSYSKIQREGGTMILVFYSYAEGIQMLAIITMIVNSITAVLSTIELNEKLRSLKQKRLTAALILAVCWISIVYILIFYHLPNKFFWNGALLVILNIVPYGFCFTVWFVAMFQRMRRAIINLAQKVRHSRFWLKSRP